MAKGKVRDEKLLKRNLIKKALLFQQMIKGIEASEVSSWIPYKIRLELTVAADATVSMALASAGGEIRMRFEWRRSFNESKEKNTLGKVAEGSRQLMNNLAEEIANAIEEEPASKKVMIENFNVSIGISLSGNVGIAEASAEILTKVSFKPSDEKEEGTKDLSQVTFINSEKVRKGFKKAIRFAEYFQQKLAKSKYKKSDWAVETISPSFSFGPGGDVGLATLEGTSELELEYHNAKF
ncbi:MAG: hypothetical protein PHY93_20645 [Bacteriovorax sp.]|nr:hypothetical protein [Bacteriovorax sp.]